MPNESALEVSRLGDARKITREWVPETPVALEFNGLAYAVMMASPSDLDDFVRGFALTEGLASGVHEIHKISVAKTEIGIIARARLSGLGVDQLTERVRVRVAESSCGLCGIENLEMLNQPLPHVPPHRRATPEAIFTAVSQMRARQPLNQRTGAAHGAGFASASGKLLHVREDVGRHNAIDKLIGAIAISEEDMARGIIIWQLYTLHTQ